MLRPRDIIFEDGPLKGQKSIALRHYLALESSDAPGGIYVWDEKKEGYVWKPGLTLKEWERQNGVQD